MNNINETITQFIIMAPALLFAITVHEVSHAYVAYLFGDNTAKALGRLTLNPLKHLDPIGLLVLFLTRMIGWAKPVPVDFRVVRRHKYGVLLVSIAGCIANVLTAIASVILLYIFNKIVFSLNLTTDNSVVEYLYLMLLTSVQINLVLALFNLIPLPPLDGSKILASLLPKHLAYQYMQLERYGFILVLGLLILNRYIHILSPIYAILEYVMNAVSRLLFGI